MKEKLIVLFILLTACVVAMHAQDKPMPAAGAQRVSIDPPATARALFSVRGEGVQIYTCVEQQQNWIWQLRAPDATLYDEQGKAIGKHFAGPTWQAEDGSAIKGTLLASQKQVTAIPWLLLSATSVGGSGKFSAIQFVRRTDTVGGRAPSTGCDAQHASTETSVPYSARYTFYSDTQPTATPAAH